MSMTPDHLANLKRVSRILKAKVTMQSSLQNQVHSMILM